ncbi:MAG: hypothetical protein PHV74_11265 [Dehalococcoidia bacterium]|nr:hypothetical protein [Dehalococcoidia bacterium]
MIKKLTLPDGSQVGIVNLESILREVADLKQVGAATIKKELLERAKACNYIAPAAEEKYAKALFREYKQQYGRNRKQEDDP